MNCIYNNDKEFNCVKQTCVPLCPIIIETLKRYGYGNPKATDLPKIFAEKQMQSVKK